MDRTPPDPGHELQQTMYGELRRVAARYLRRERRNHTLQPTALVHEAWMRLQNQDAQWQGRTHVLAVGAQAMRRLLVDHGRHQKRDKRGGGATPLSLDDVLNAAATGSVPVEDLLTVEKRSPASRRSTRAPRRWSRCASSPACPIPKSPSISTCPSGPSKATGRTPAPGSSASWQDRTAEVRYPFFCAAITESLILS